MSEGKQRRKLRRVETVRIELEPETETSAAIVLHVRPITSADVDVATLNVIASLGAAADGDAAKRKFGLAQGVNVPPLHLAGAAIPDALLAVQLGLSHIVSWEGLGLGEEDADEPLPVSEESVTLLLTSYNPRGRSYAHIFLAQACSRSILEASAKKGSAVSPDTSSGEAASSATSAAPATTPAPPGGE